jgi:diaminopimelate epimerase
VIPLEKYHALGNDDLVAVESELPLELTPAVVRLIYNRHRDVGSDEIL